MNDEQQFLIESNLNNDSLLQAQINLQLQQQQQQPSSSSINNQHNSRHHHHNNNNNNINHQQLPSSHICNNSHNTTLSHNNNNNNSVDSKHYNASATTATTADAVNDIDNDPKNRYFRAFPALSKEMEESFRIWRRNAKSFTWPIVGRSIQGVDNCNNNNNNPNNNNNNSNSNSASLSSSSASSIISTSNFGISLTNSADKLFDKKIKSEGGGLSSHSNQLANKVSAETASVQHISDSGNINSGDVEQHQAAVGAVVSAKKKSKRRRNQGKKLLQNLTLKIIKFLNSL